MRGRRAFTLVEALIAVAIGAVVIGILYMMMTKSVGTQDATAKGIELMVQARTTLENLTRDVHQALVFLPSEGQSGGQELVIIRDALSEERPRLKENQADQTNYPFVNSGQVTVQRMPAQRVRYVYSPEQGTLTRFCEDGMLEAAAAQSTLNRICQYRFTPGGHQERPNQLAKDLARPSQTEPPGFFVGFIAFDRFNMPRTIQEVTPEDFGLQSFPGDEATFRMNQTTILWVRLKLRFDKGRYGKDPQNPEPGKDRPAEEVEIATKIASFKRLADVRDKEWFSSVDEDLRF